MSLVMSQALVLPRTTHRENSVKICEIYDVPLQIIINVNHENIINSCEKIDNLLKLK